MFDINKLIADIQEGQSVLRDKGATDEMLLKDGVSDRFFELMDAGHSGTSAAEIVYQELQEGKL